MAKLDKARVLDALRLRTRQSLERLIASQQATQAGATHEETQPENDKDTRAIEATYLARGLAERVESLENGVTQNPLLVTMSSPLRTILKIRLWKVLFTQRPKNPASNRN